MTDVNPARLRRLAADLTPAERAELFAFLSGASPDRLAEALDFIEQQRTAAPSPAEILQLEARELGHRVLALPMAPGNPADVETVGEYLIALLRKLWTETDQFYGKYGVGDSDWPYDLYRPLVTAGLIKGTFDEDGYAEDVDTKEGDRLIHLAINALAPAP